MIYGHKHQGEFEIPDWAGRLKEYYWVIRVEGRDKSKQRRYYRLVEREKLRLAESLIDQDLILLVCRYLVSYKPSSGFRMIELMSRKPNQLKLQFSRAYNDK